MRVTTTDAVKTAAIAVIAVTALKNNSTMKAALKEEMSAPVAQQEATAVATDLREATGPIERETTGAATDLPRSSTRMNHLRNPESQENQEAMLPVDPEAVIEAATHQEAISAAEAAVETMVPAEATEAEVKIDPLVRTTTEVVAEVAVQLSTMIVNQKEKAQPKLFPKAQEVE